MKGLQKHIHGLKVKKGLKKSWLAMLQKHNKQQSRWPQIEAEIALFDKRITDAELLLKKPRKQATNSPIS